MKIQGAPTMIPICKLNCPADKCRTNIWNCPKCPDKTRTDYTNYSQGFMADINKARRER